MVALTRTGPEEQLTIAGGGITGLTAAYRAIQNGQDPSRIRVLEASGRLGGKIQTGYFADGSFVNLGAEFIDSEHTQLLELCHALGVTLTPAGENDGLESYQTSAGGVLSGSAFHAAFAPLHAAILKDKAEILARPNGPLAQQINALSMEQYLERLRAEVPVQAAPSILTRIRRLFQHDVNRVSAETAHMAMQGFASETGRPAYEISALQFLHEVSGEPDALLASDCGFRVAGGTEKIVEALTAKLKEAGVQFETNAALDRVARGQDGLQLTLRNGHTVQADRLVLALPAYALARVQGLDALGMPASLQQSVGATQYTHGLKLTVKLKPGIKPQQGAFFADGYQVWSAKPDEVTFLVNFDAAKGITTTSRAVEYVMQNYAAARGLSAEQFYDKGPGKMLVSSPGAHACYASPAPGQAMGLEGLRSAFAPLEANGVGIAGSFLPLRTKEGVELGFMECGVDTAYQLIGRMVPPVRERAGWMQQILAPQASMQPKAVGATR